MKPWQWWALGLGVAAAGAVGISWLVVQQFAGNEHTDVYKGFTIKTTCNALGYNQCASGWNISSSTASTGAITFKEAVAGVTYAASLQAAKARIDGYDASVQPA